MEGGGEAHLARVGVAHPPRPARQQLPARGPLPVPASGAGGAGRDGGEAVEGLVARLGVGLDHL